MNQVFLSRLFPSALMALVVAIASPAGAQDKASTNADQHAKTVVPIEAFFQNASINKVSLSPDGKTIGMLVATSNGRIQLATMDAEVRKPRVIAGFANADIEDFYWVNNERLVYTTEDRKKAQGETRYYPGLYALNRDGSETRTLIERIWIPDSTAASTIKSKVLSGTHRFLQVDDSEGSESVFVTEPVFNAVYDVEALKLKRVNTRTGDVETFPRPGNSHRWMIDHQGQPRITITQDHGKERIWYRDPRENQWQVISESTTFAGENFAPYELGVDGTLYVVARTGRDHSALYRFDLKNKTLEDKPLVAIDGYDFSGSLISDRSKAKIVGIRYANDAYTTLWLDVDMKRIQAEIDAQLPNTINLISLSRKGLGNTLLVRAYSDVQPSVFLSYDVAAKKLDMIGSTHPAINPSKMAMQDMIRYKAKDGLEIPAYLTMPQGAKKNLPLIVMVHGGPYVRGHTWGWNPETQFLASRGYAVIEPEFRGSTGFGFKHFEAGWKQWGLAMQEDIADAARWAIAQGIADPKRICIAGASYGGYATLMGLAKNPELFKCGVNWVGVTDLRLMYQSSWTNDASELWQQYGLPVFLGDKVADAERLAATSPVELTDKIQQPLLMAYGAADRRVPIEHGNDFYARIKKTNNKVEWIRYNEEGHGWYLPETNIDFWNKVAQFLERNLSK